MRGSWKLLSFFFLICFTAPSLTLALDVPEKPAGHVNDHAGLLSDQTRLKLEKTLRVYETKTSNQIVIATFPSLEGDSLEDFSIRLAENWKVGQKGRDNGIIFLIFKEDRKMRIEVGYGLEGTLPDAVAGQIIQQVVAPSFIEGDYERGILLGIQAILKATAGEYAQQEAQPYGSRELTQAEIEALERQGRAVGLFLLILVGIFFVIDFFRYRGYVQSHRVYNDRYSFWEWWVRFAILLFVLGVLFRVLFYAMLFSRGGYHGSRSGFGGFSGGGGGFGGGGASGSW